MLKNCTTQAPYLQVAQFQLEALAHVSSFLLTEDSLLDRLNIHLSYKRSI